jgi:transposase
MSLYHEHLAAFWRKHDPKLGTMTDASLGALISVSRRSVFDRRKKLGIKPHRNHPHAAEWRARARALLSEGMTVADVAKAFGKHPATIRHARRSRSEGLTTGGRAF